MLGIPLPKRIDLQISEVLQDQSDMHLQSVVIVHLSSLFLVLVASRSMFAHHECTVTVFDTDPWLDECRITVARDVDEVEMMGLP